MRLPPFRKIEKYVNIGSGVFIVLLFFAYIAVIIYSRFIPYISSNSLKTPQRVYNYQGKANSTFPQEIFESAQNIIELDLSKNTLTELPSELIQLTELSALNISNNSFSKLPIVLSNMDSVKTLNISFNSLSLTATQIAEMDSLSALIISEGMMPLAEQTKLKALKPSLVITVLPNNLSQ